MSALLRFTQFVQKTFALWVIILQLWRYGNLNFCLAESLYSMDFGHYYAWHGNDHDCRRL